MSMCVVSAIFNVLVACLCERGYFGWHCLVACYLLIRQLQLSRMVSCPHLGFMRPSVTSCPYSHRTEQTMHCQGLSTHLRRTGAQVWWRCLGPFPGCTLLQMRARQVHGLHSNAMHAPAVRRHQPWRAAASIHALLAGGAPQWWVEGLHAGMSASCKDIA